MPNEYATDSGVRPGPLYGMYDYDATRFAPRAAFVGRYARSRRDLPTTNYVNETNRGPRLIVGANWRL